MVCRIAIREHQQGGHQRRFVMRGVHDDRSRPTDPLSLPPDLLSKHCLSMSVDLPRTDGRSALDQRPVAMSVEDNRAITIRLSVPVQVDIKPFLEQCKIHCIDPINMDKNFLYLGWPQLGGDRRERERGNRSNVGEGIGRRRNRTEHHSDLLEVICCDGIDRHALRENPPWYHLCMSSSLSQYSHLLPRTRVGQSKMPYATCLNLSSSHSSTSCKSLWVEGEGGWVSQSN